MPARPASPTRVSTPVKKPARSRRTVAALPSPLKRPHAPKPCAQNTMSLVAAGARIGAFDDRRLRIGERALDRLIGERSLRPAHRQRRHAGIAAIARLPQPAEDCGAGMQALVHQHAGGRGMHFAGELIERCGSWAPDSPRSAENAGRPALKAASCAAATASWFGVPVISCPTCELSVNSTSVGV